MPSRSPAGWSPRRRRRPGAASACSMRPTPPAPSSARLAPRSSPPGPLGPTPPPPPSTPPGPAGPNGPIPLLGGLNLLAGAVLFAAEPVGRQARQPGDPGRGAASRGRGRVVAAGLAGLAVLGIVASSLDLPITRTFTEN